MVVSQYVVPLLSLAATNTSLFGAKAPNLTKAAQFGLAIPRTCSEGGFSLITQDILGELSPPIAVRFSATEEDSAAKAFAGIFETRLGIWSANDLVNAFAEVKSSGEAICVKDCLNEIVPDSIEYLDEGTFNTFSGRKPTRGSTATFVCRTRTHEKFVLFAIQPDAMEYE